MTDVQFWLIQLKFNAYLKGLNQTVAETIQDPIDRNFFIGYQNDIFKLVQKYAKKYLTEDEFMESIRSGVLEGLNENEGKGDIDSNKQSV